MSVPPSISNDARPTLFAVVIVFNFESAIEPANCAFVTPLDLIVTAPELTLKSSELNDATPLLDVDASSPVIVIVVQVAEVSIASPPDMVNVSESKSISIVPLSVVASRSCAVT